MKRKANTDWMSKQTTNLWHKKDYINKLFNFTQNLGKIKWKITF